MSAEIEAKFAHNWVREPRFGDGPGKHAEYHVLRAIGFAKGWLDRTLWVDSDHGRPRSNQLLIVLAEAEVARLWVGIRDLENAQDVADWTENFEDPDVWLEWLGNQAKALGYEWDQILPYGGDNQ